MGALPPRYALALNPYGEFRCTTCPGCRARTRLRKVPLVIHAEGAGLLVLRKACRLCVSCEMVVVAGMLQHSVREAYRRHSSRPPRESVAASLLNTANEGDPECVAREIGDVVGRLFSDARVSADRVNARGDPYSIVDSALQEFISWENMPWE